MIIASDLDRTLMYSARAIKELNAAEEQELKPVEMKEGRWIGFMTETALRNLKQLSQQALFIPVTTRTTEQFSRIVIFETDIALKYAITANGADILYYGRKLEEWSEQVLQTMNTESLSMAEMLALLKSEGFSYASELRQVENLFFYYHFKSVPDLLDKNALHALAAVSGWRISLQGRKLYFIPKAISKGAALEFICQREGLKAVAGAGDSILDWDFLQHCQHRFVPKHGELVSRSEHGLFTVIEQTGLKAGEMIIKEFLKLIPLNCPSFNNKIIKTGKQTVTANEEENRQ